METRANFVLIGAFTLLGILGALGFMIWLASFQFDRQYARYGILFEDVSGLSSSGDVLYNGISVGHVVDLRISDQDPSKVYVEIQVAADTPVREDTIAQLSSSGVTGVSYISLTNRQSEAEPLTAEPGELPLIPSRRSTVQQLVEDAPDMITEATKLLRQFQRIAGPRNQAHVENILSNIEHASGGLDQALSDFSRITGVVSEATKQISLFTDRLDSVAASAETTLVYADETLESATGAFEAAEKTITASTDAIESARTAFAQVEELITGQVPIIVARITETVTALNDGVREIAAKASGTIDNFDETAALMNARLTELETTLDEANNAFAAVSSASGGLDEVIRGDGKALVAEARAAIASIESVIDEDVPVVVNDIREGVTTARAAVERVANNLTSATGRLDPLAESAQKTLASVRHTFDRAGQTMDNLDRSLAAGDRALASAETAFDTATGVMATDLDPVLNDLRAASDRVAAAANRVSDDLPGVTEDLKALIARADAVVADVQSTVAASAPGVREFAGTGLPEIARLGSEGRSLLRSLERLIRRIERNPTQFLLNERVPEYRR